MFSNTFCNIFHPRCGLAFLQKWPAPEDSALTCWLSWNTTSVWVPATVLLGSRDGVWRRVGAVGFTYVLLFLFHWLLLTGREHGSPFSSLTWLFGFPGLVFFSLQFAVSLRISYGPIRFPKYQFLSMTLNIWTLSNYLRQQGVPHRLSCFLTQTVEGAICPAWCPLAVWGGPVSTRQRGRSHSLVCAWPGPTSPTAAPPTRGDSTALSPRWRTDAWFEWPTNELRLRIIYVVCNSRWARRHAPAFPKSLKKSQVSCASRRLAPWYDL